MLGNWSVSIWGISLLGAKSKYIAKINRPVFESAIERKRLISIMDGDGVESLIWISGPAGFGKTTFISNYIDHKNIPCVWYQWDRGDKDPATFYYYFGQAAQKESTLNSEDITSYTPEFASDPETFSQRYFETIFESLNTPALIVFDNFINQPDKFFLDILLAILIRLPPNLKIIVVSRSEPPPALSILTVRNQMKVINEHDLRFDLDEFKQAATLYGMTDISEEALKAMHNKVDGWIAGLMLMAEGHKRADGDLEVKAGSNNQEIYNFFAGEIDKGLDDGTRSFLIATSFLPQFSAQSAKLLTGYEQCDAVLNYLTSHNLFTARRNIDPPIYQYHSLFREYLQKKAVELMTKEQFTEVKMLSANILKDTGQHEQAALFYADLHLWEDLISLILENASGMLLHGRYKLVDEWISAIPEDIISGDRHLQFWKGSCKFPFSPGTSRRYFKKCLKLAIEAGDAGMAYSAWTASVESTVFEFNNFYELDALIEGLEQLRAEFPEYPSKKIEGTVSTAMLAALVFRRIEHPDIEYWARKAISIAAESEMNRDQIMVGLIEAMRHFYAGDMVTMRVTIETLIEPFEEQDIGLSLRSLVLYLTSLKEWTLGNLEICEEIIQEGLKTAEITGVHNWDLLLLGQGAICALTAEDRDLTQRYLERMNKLLVRASNNDKSHYHYLFSWAAYLSGDTNLAASYARNAYQLKKELGNPFGIGSNRLAIAESLWAGGSKKEAINLLAESRNDAELAGKDLLSFLCDIAEARFSLDEGEVDKAVQFLRSAFAFGSVKGIYTFFWFRKDVMSRLCSLAIGNGIELDYALKLIKIHNLAPDNTAQGLEEWPWSVKLYTLGRFELVINGRPVKFTGKSQERPMSLLKAILALGGRKVSSFNLAEALWPDSDGPTGQQTLATTLHRLRRLIGVDEAVIFSKNSVTLNPKMFWVDIWAVERAMGHISPWLEYGLKNEGKVTNISSNIEKALGLYKGHFLSHDGNESWSITLRERLRSKFIRNLKNYCAYLESQNEDKKALKWYQKALELENLAEELYQGLIMCYHRLGQKADAISTYNRCREVLSDVLGVEPSQATEAIREKVLKGS